MMMMMTNAIPQSPVYQDYLDRSTEPSEPRPEQVSNFDLNKKYQPWTIIDTYFRDNSYYKSQHQMIHLMNLLHQMKMVFE